MNASLPRVVHIVPSLVTGGMEKLVARLMFRRAVDRTAVICLHDLGNLGRELVAQGRRVTRLRPRQGKLTQAFQLRRQLQRWRADVVHCHNLQAFTFGALAAQADRRLKVVLTKHGTRMPADRTLGERLRVWMARRSRIVAVSPEIQQLLATWTGQSPQRVSLIPNGLDVDDAQPSRDESRLALGLPVDRTLISCVARLSQEKDHETLLRALQQVVGDHPRTCLLVVGDGPLRSSLESLSDDLGLAGHVKFLGERNDVNLLLAASDMAVLTSQTEGMPLCVLEAMAARLPVVCSRVGGIPEMFEHNRHGLLVPAGQPAAFARAILDVCQRPDHGRSLGVAGREHVRDQFSLHHTMEQYEALYDSGSSITR